MISLRHCHPGSRLCLGKAAGTACSVLLFLAACSRDSTPVDTEAASAHLADTEVARVGDTTISRKDFEQEWNRRTDSLSKEELLREMIQFESLLKQALAAGVDRAPDLRAAFHRMVVGKFQEEQLQRRGLDSIQVSEAEIASFYLTHSNRFATPKRIRLGLIQRKASPKATPAVRAQLRQEAEALWTQARQAPSDDVFRQLVVQHSDDQATRYAGGDTGWIIPEQLLSGGASEVHQAAMALSAPGQLAPLLETAGGFYIVKLLGVQAASQRPLPEVRDGIQYQLRMEKARQLRAKFFEEMQTNLSIEINRAVLEAVPERSLHSATRPPPTLPN